MLKNTYRESDFYLVESIIFQLIWDFFSIISMWNKLSWEFSLIIMIFIFLKKLPTLYIRGCSYHSYSSILFLIKRGKPKPSLRRNKHIPLSFICWRESLGMCSGDCTLLFCQDSVWEMPVACSGLYVFSEAYLSSHCCFPGSDQSQRYDVENQWRISEGTGSSGFSIYSVN